MRHNRAPLVVDTYSQFGIWCSASNFIVDAFMGEDFEWVNSAANYNIPSGVRYFSSPEEADAAMVRVFLMESVSC